MGGQSFCHKIQASSACEAFSRLRSEAEYEFGNDSYNGTISTCSMGRCVKKFSSYSPKNLEKAYKLIENEYHYGEKWSADYIDLGVVKCNVNTYKKVNKTYTAKYKQQFVVCNSEMEPTRYHYDTKPKADEKVLELMMKNNCTCYVRKMMIKVSGDDLVTSFTVETKTYQKVPKLKPMPNRKIQEIHEYVFFGIASC